MKKVLTIVVILGFMGGILYPSIAAAGSKDLIGAQKFNAGSDYKFTKSVASKGVGFENSDRTVVKQRVQKTTTQQPAYKVVGNAAATQPIVVKTPKTPSPTPTPLPQPKAPTMPKLFNFGKK